jgi:hypothetical protein
VKFDGLLIGDTGPVSPCSVNGIVGGVSYTSQNPNYPGTGVVLLGACDNGQPGANNGGLYVGVLSGPYSGYSNQGFLTGGNLNAH